MDVSLLTAALDLKLVRLLRAAMNGGRVTSLGPAATHHPFTGALRGFDPYETTAPGAVASAPQPAPAQAVAARDVVQWSPAVDPSRTPHCDVPFDTTATPDPINTRKPGDSLAIFPPPWKNLPIDTPPPVVVKVKVVKQEVDIISKGSLLDFFC